MASPFGIFFFCWLRRKRKKKKEEKQAERLLEKFASRTLWECWVKSGDVTLETKKVTALRMEGRNFLWLQPKKKRDTKDHKRMMTTVFFASLHEKQNINKTEQQQRWLITFQAKNTLRESIGKLNVCTWDCFVLHDKRIPRNNPGEKTGHCRHKSNGVNRHWNFGWFKVDSATAFWRVYSEEKMSSSPTGPPPPVIRSNSFSSKMTKIMTAAHNMSPKIGRRNTRSHRDDHSGRAHFNLGNSSCFSHGPQIIQVSGCSLGDIGENLGPLPRNKVSSRFIHLVFFQE